jgi:hypothetical protein
LTGRQLRDGCDVVEKCEQAAHSLSPSLLKADREREAAFEWPTAP